MAPCVGNLELERRQRLRENVFILKRHRLRALDAVAHHPAGIFIRRPHGFLIRCAVFHFLQVFCTHDHAAGHVVHHFKRDSGNVHHLPQPLSFRQLVNSPLTGQKVTCAFPSVRLCLPGHDVPDSFCDISHAHLRCQHRDLCRLVQCGRQVAHDGALSENSRELVAKVQKVSPELVFKHAIHLCLLPCQLVRVVIQYGHELPVLRHTVDIFEQTVDVFVQCRVCLLLRQARALCDPVRRFQESDLLLQRCIVHLSRLRNPVADPVPRILPAKVF